ncbi:hypothetical protein H4I95_12156 [Botrytis cinerea]
MRTAPLENHTDETETGVRYTNAQWKCIQRIRNKLDENTPADDETEDRSLINALMCLYREDVSHIDWELQALMNVLTFGSPVPPIDLSRIVDSMAWSQAFRRQNFSFITHAQNQDQVRGDYGFLLERARRKGGGWRLLQTNPTTKKVEWVDSQVTAYLTKERQFLRKLMWLSRPGGQPARGPELGSIKSNRDPVFSAGSTICSSIGSSESEYLFGDLRGPWAGEELSQALGSATRKHLGVYLRASGWRHTAIGIATRYLMRASKTWEKEHEDPEDGGDEFAEGDDDEELELDTFRHIMVRQSGHGRRVAQAHYAIDGAFLHRLGPELITEHMASVYPHDKTNLGQVGLFPHITR